MPLKRYQIMSESKVNIRDIIREEYKKCLADPIYFMKKYVKIQHTERGTLPFELYPFQENALDDLVNNKYNIILKSRQMGISTLVSAYALWLMIFHTDKTVLVISRAQDASKEIVTKIRFANDHLPSWLKVPCVEDNRLSMRLKNGSRVKAVASSPNAARGEAVSFLILDECAHIKEAEEIWVSAQATLSTGGSAVLLSTPNGVGGFFHKMWTDSESNESGFGFNTIKLPWNLHPERDQLWRDRQTTLQGDPRKAAQECDCDFTTSGHSVIEADILKWYRETTIKEPIEMRGNDKGLWIWEYPSYIKSYLVCADVARGDGADKSAFHVIDIENLTQVAEYRGVIDTKAYGNLLVSIATEYNNAILVVENNNIGWATLQQIIDRSYPNTFYSSADATYVDVERQMVGNINRMEKKMVPGFTTTSKTRPLIISKLESYLRERSFGLHSSRTLDELSVFMWTGNRAEAMSGYNDDLVTSLGIGLWVRDTALRLRTESDEFRKTLINNISKTQNSGVYTRSDDDAKNSWSMPVDTGNKFNPNSAGHREDLSWLL